MHLAMPVLIKRQNSRKTVAGIGNHHELYVSLFILSRILPITRLPLATPTPPFHIYFSPVAAHLIFAQHVKKREEPSGYRYRDQYHSGEGTLER